MQLVIHDKRTISDIREEFNRIFPYLKLDFFSRLHPPGHSTALKFRLPEDKLLGDMRQVHTTGEIAVVPEMTVLELEQVLGREYGLGVQVFRKSGRIWLETILTDNWTLGEQNSEGEFLSKPVAPDEPGND